MAESSWDSFSACWVVAWPCLSCPRNDTRAFTTVHRLCLTAWWPPWRTSSTYSLSTSSLCSSLLSSPSNCSRGSSFIAPIVRRTQRRSACKNCDHTPLTVRSGCPGKSLSTFHSGLGLLALLTPFPFPWNYKPGRIIKQIDICWTPFLYLIYLISK